MVEEFVITNKKEPKLEEEQDYVLTKQKMFQMPFLVFFIKISIVGFLNFERQKTPLVRAGG